MANAKNTKSASSEPTSGIVAVHKLDEDGKPLGEPHYASASAKWVVDGLADGTVKLLEEVAADATQLPAQGDAANAGSGSTGS